GVGDCENQGANKVSKTRVSASDSSRSSSANNSFIRNLLYKIFCAIYFGKKPVFLKMLHVRILLKLFS
ncbi:MAG: hypothetical protein ACLSTL_12690, partial [Eubacterium sp.]